MIERSELIVVNGYKIFAVVLVGLVWGFAQTTWAYDTATLAKADEFGFSIAVGTKHNCAIDNNGVKCWGDNQYGQINVPALSNPTQVSVGAMHSCALDDTGVKCWGYSGFEQLNVPTLSNPKYISSGGGFQSCAIDDTGVKCWGRSSDFPIPALSHPRQLSVSAYNACVIDDTGVKCWGDPKSSCSNVPPLSNPKEISTGYAQACAIDDTGVKCWPCVEHFIATVPPLLNPRGLSASDMHACAIDDTGVKCWGQTGVILWQVPRLSNGTQVSVGYCRTCVTEDSGIKCWGSLNIPTPEAIQNSLLISYFALSTLDRGLENLSKYFYIPKARFIFGLSELAKKFPNPLSRMLILWLVEPTVELTTTEFIQNKVIPKYRYSIQNSFNKLGIKSIQDIGANPSTLEIAIDVAALALKYAHMSILSAESKKSISVLLSEVGTLKAERQTEKLATLLQKNKTLIEELVQNNDTKSFALVLLKIETFLNGK